MLQERELGKDNAAAEIGEAAMLTVDLSQADKHRTDLRYRYLPLKNVQERQVSEELRVDEVGYFGLELVDNTTQQSCKLLSMLKLSCGKGFELGKKNKCTAVESHVVQLVFGGLAGALFAAGLLSLLVYAKRDPQRFKKLIGSFLMNEINVIVSLCGEIWDFGGD